MKRFLLVGATLLSVVGPVQAEQDKLGVTLELSYLSRWLSKGVKAYGQQGALFKTIDIDLYGTGFGLNVTHRNATASGYVDKQRFDYRPYYKGQLFDGTTYAMNYNLSAGYEHYPGLERSSANTTWEWIYAFSWPNIMPEGFVPGYIAHYEYPAGSGHINRYVTGWVHRFRLCYDLHIQEIDKPIQLSSEVAYTDGLGGAAHDWSYATFGASTQLQINERLSFLPGVYYQISMEDTVCTDDLTYCILSIKYVF